MKKKVFRKRLALKKNTVANLESRQLSAAKGGTGVVSVCIVFETCGGACPTGQYNCTTQDPNRICAC